MYASVRGWVRATPLLVAVFSVACLVAPASADSGAEIRLAVASFQEAGPPGEELPDVATLLADRLGTSGVEHIVGPAALGAPAEADPSAGDIQAWAKRAEVDAVVVGRTTRIGSQLSVDARLRSGASGEVVGGPYIVEVARADQLASAVQRLAGQVLDGADGMAEDLDAVPASNAPASGRSGPFGSDAPITIKSDSLEATDSAGKRRLIFTGNVKVKQGQIRMSSARLVADYPQGGSQPDRLVATGAVRIEQNGQVASCNEGTYRRSNDVLRCCGNAQLRDGPNRVNGSCIEFDLVRDKINVKDATIEIVPEGSPN